MNLQSDSSQSFERNSAGSPGQGEPAFLTVGLLRKPHGLGGEIEMEIHTDFPERLRPGKRVYVGEDHQLIRLAAVRQKPPLLLIRLEGILDRDSAEAFRGKMVYTSVEHLPVLEEGRYYHYQLLGLTVQNESGQVLGELTEILETGANDVFVVKQPDGSELLLPVIKPVFLGADLEKRVITVRPLEWE